RDWSGVIAHVTATADPRSRHSRASARSASQFFGRKAEKREFARSREGVLPGRRCHSHVVSISIILRKRRGEVREKVSSGIARGSGGNGIKKSAVVHWFTKES